MTKKSINKSDTLNKCLPCEARKMKIATLIINIIGSKNFLSFSVHQNQILYGQLLWQAMK